MSSLSELRQLDENEDFLMQWDSPFLLTAWLSKGICHLLIRMVLWMVPAIILFYFLFFHSLCKLSLREVSQNRSGFTNLILFSCPRLLLNIIPIIPLIPVLLSGSIANQFIPHFSCNSSNI